MADLASVSERADYALLQPELFTTEFEMSKKDMAEVSKAVRGYAGPGSLDGETDAVPSLKKAFFASVVELYGNMALTPAQMKSLVRSAAVCNDPSELTMMFVMAHCSVSDTWDVFLANDFINRSIKDLPCPWYRKLYLRYRVNRISDASREKLRRALRDEGVRSLVERFADKDEVTTVHMPGSYMEAKKVKGCTEKAAGLTACIMDFPDRTYSYQLRSKLRQRLARLKRMESLGLPSKVIEDEWRLINESRTILMLCSAVKEGRKDGTPSITPSDIAKVLSKVYPDEDGGASKDVYGVLRELETEGFREELPTGYEIPEYAKA